MTLPQDIRRLAGWHASKSRIDTARYLYDYAQLLEARKPSPWRWILVIAIVAVAFYGAR